MASKDPKMGSVPEGGAVLKPKQIINSKPILTSTNDKTMMGTDLSETTQKLARSALSNAAANAAKVTHATKAQPGHSSTDSTRAPLRPESANTTSGNEGMQSYRQINTKSIGMERMASAPNKLHISSTPMVSKSTSTATIMSNKSAQSKTQIKTTFQPGLIPLAPAPPGVHGFQPIAMKPRVNSVNSIHSNSHHRNSTAGGITMLARSSSENTHSMPLSNSIGHSNGIKLTTSKNWVLPPRPKTKKVCKKQSKNASASNTTTSVAATSNSAATPSCILTPSTTISTPTTMHTVTNFSPNKSADSSNRRNVKSPYKKTGLEAIKSVDVDTESGKVLINSQIHSNINLLTNDPNELKIQFENVKGENENLKKILKKLNKEIDNLKISSTPSPLPALDLNVSSSISKSSNHHVSTPSDFDFKSLQIDSEANEFFTSPETDSSIGTGTKNVNLSKDISLSAYIDPMNLSCNLETKRHKSDSKIKGRLSTNSNGIQRQSKNYLSPKEIMSNPVNKKVTKKRKKKKVDESLTNIKIVNDEDLSMFQTLDLIDNNNNHNINTNTANNDLNLDSDIDLMNVNFGMNYDLTTMLDFDSDITATNNTNNDPNNNDSQTTINNNINNNKLKEEQMMVRGDSKNSNSLPSSALLEFDLFTSTSGLSMNSIDQNLKDAKDDMITY